MGNSVPNMIERPRSKGFTLEHICTVPDRTAKQWLLDRGILVSDIPEVAYLVDKSQPGFAIYLYRSTTNQWLQMSHPYYVP